MAVPSNDRPRPARIRQRQYQPTADLVLAPSAHISPLPWDRPRPRPHPLLLAAPSHGRPCSRPNLYAAAINASTLPAFLPTAEPVHGRPRPRLFLSTAVPIHVRTCPRPNLSTLPQVYWPSFPLSAAYRLITICKDEKTEADIKR